MEAIKLSKYFELINPTYTYIQIMPHRSIRNYNSSNIAKAIGNTYKSINQRIYREQKKIFVLTGSIRFGEHYNKGIRYYEKKVELK